MNKQQPSTKASTSTRQLAGWHGAQSAGKALASIAFILLSAACAGSHERATPSDQPSQVDPAQDPEQAPYGLPDLCDGLPRLEDTLSLVPPFPLAFIHTSEPCDSLGTGILLRNTAAIDLEVIRIGLRSNKFEASLQTLPAVVPTGGSLPVSISYLGANENGDETLLQVVTSQGCSEFSIHGIATSDSLVTTSDSAIDFGTVLPMSLWERPFQVRYQRSPEYAQSGFFGFSAGPSPIFALVNAPEGIVQPESCSSFVLTVRFNAPAEPGPLEGTMSYMVTVDLPEGTAEGVVLINLLGNVAGATR